MTSTTEVLNTNLSRVCIKFGEKIVYIKQNQISNLTLFEILQFAMWYDTDTHIHANITQQSLYNGCMHVLHCISCVANTLLHIYAGG